MESSKKTVVCPECGKQCFTELDLNMIKTMGKCYICKLKAVARADSTARERGEDVYYNIFER